MNHKIQLLAIAPYEALKHVILKRPKNFPSSRLRWKSAPFMKA